MSLLFHKLGSVKKTLFFNMFLQYTSQIKVANKKQKELRKCYGKDCHFFVAMYQGTGDIYFDCMYLESFAIQQAIQNYCLLVIGSACKNVGKLYPGIPIEMITLEERNAITKYRCLTKDGRIHLLHYDTPLFRNGVFVNGYLRGFRDINFLDLLWTVSFHDVECLSLRKPHFDARKAAEFCKENHLLAGKTVILSPFAVSMLVLLPKIFWGRIIFLLKENGFCVCTNCGMNEKELWGTKKLFFEYPIAVPVLDYCGYYIGLRSGFTDIISESTCKKIVLYPKNIQKGYGNSLSCYSLAALGLDSNAVEYEFDETKKDDSGYYENLAEQIVSNIVKMEC